MHMVGADRTDCFMVSVWVVSVMSLTAYKQARLHTNFNPTFYWTYDYLPMLALKLIHVNKRGLYKEDKKMLNLPYGYLIDPIRGWGY